MGITRRTTLGGALLAAPGSQSQPESDKTREDQVSSSYEMSDNDQGKRPLPTQSILDKQYEPWRELGVLVVMEQD